MRILLPLLAVAAALQPPVRFPEHEPPPAPMPAPTPVSLLTADRLYVIDSDVDGFLLVRPGGLVTVGKDVGPVRIRGKFVDGSGKTETRVYKGKAVFTLEAVGTGRVYIDFVPVGAASEKDIVSRVVDVDAGQGPQPPPPGPNPPKPPDPTPPAPIPGDGLRVLVVYETADLTRYPAAQVNLMTAGKVVGYLNSKCAVGPDGKTREWRMYDKDADVSRDYPVWQNAMKRPRTSLPWLIVSNGKTGFEGPLPADADAFLTLVQKYEK